MKKWLFVMIAVLLPLLGIARAEGDVSAKETLSKSEYGTGDSQGSAAEAAAMPELPDAADVLPECPPAAQEDRATGVFSELDGKRIGVQIGTNFDAIILNTLPNAKISYYNSFPDLATALETSKIDAFPGDEPVLRLMAAENDNLTVMDGRMDPFEFGFVLPKTEAGEKLLAQIDAWLAEFKASGALDEVVLKWTEGQESEKTLPDYAGYPAPNGVLTMATEGAYAPMNYYRGSDVVGFEIELAARFCEANGYGLEVEVMGFDGILPAVQTGKVDFAASGIAITDERRESVNFSIPYYSGGTAMAVLKAEGEQSSKAPSPSAAITLSALNGKRIGVQTGTSFDAMVRQKLPDAQLEYFNGKADLMAALTGRKIDAFVVDEPVAQILMRESDQVTSLPEYLDSYEFALVFPKSEAGERLRDQFNAFLEQLPEGTLEQLSVKWFGEDEAAKTMLDIAALKPDNGTLRLATESGYAPFEYVRDGAVVGYDMELAAMFCEFAGYGLEIVDMNFDGILPAVQTGKCDFAAAGISVTPERAESVLFSGPNFSGGTVAVVLKDFAGIGATASGGLWQDYNGKRLGVLVGPLMEDVAREFFPDSEYLLLDSYPDCITALLTGKIDAFLGDEPEVKIMRMEHPDISYFPEHFTQNNYCFAFRKDDPKSAALCAELNDFITRCHVDGTIQALEDIWFGADEGRKTVDMSGLTGENGTIRVVTTSTDMPFSYIKDGKNVGYDIDLVVRFCRDRGYALELGDVDFNGRIPAIVSGKYDFSTDMNATPERKEQVLFSDPTSYGGIVLAVLNAKTVAPSAADQGVETAEGSAEDTSFWGGIRSSFNKTFIRENRWRLFAQGILTTLLITMLSILFGTMLGFGVFMLCRNGNLVANHVTRFSMWMVQGMPMVVLLMILFYIIFGSVAISGTIVAVIGFTLTFGAAVFGLLKMGVGAVDNGQYEAAYALGYSNRRTFFRIILPQALPHVLPAYRGEIVGLIKATAIVGYIAVQDLTKMGDIVRSRTYEPFFPLIAITVIYFALEGLIGFLIGRASVSFNPKRRKPADILKGVKTDDHD
ncbi:MAG: transporter substrate-binding domain-containing protein [Clostridia bacterium]|nr:transporter substrate-binding domain-containing protein [Clostridia bacterium]